jgi:hypothetical protein
VVVVEDGCDAEGEGQGVVIKVVFGSEVMMRACVGGGKGRANGEFLHYETKYLNQGIARIKTI